MSSVPVVCCKTAGWAAAVLKWLQGYRRACFQELLASSEVEAIQVLLVKLRPSATLWRDWLGDNHSHDSAAALGMFLQVLLNAKMFILTSPSVYKVGTPVDVGGEFFGKLR